MIESVTPAGPLAGLRTHPLPPSAPLMAPSQTETFALPDPNAPVGPKPTFSVTPMERLQQDLRAFPNPEPEAPEKAAGSVDAPAAAFPEPQGMGRVDLRA